METLTVREASALTRMRAHTLRYYERAGLIEPMARTPAGHRRYARADLEHPQFLHCLRATGMPIRRMLEFAALVRQGQAARPAALALLETHRAEVRERRPFAGIWSTWPAPRSRPPLPACGSWTISSRSDWAARPPTRCWKLAPR